MAVRALFVTTIAAFVLLLAGIPMFMHPITGYSGLRLHLTGALIQRNIVDVDAGSPAARAGLHSGDVVSCLSVRDYRFLFDPVLYGPPTGYLPGTPIRLCVQRGGTTRVVQFFPKAGPKAASLYHGDGFAALRLAAYAVFLLCAIAIVLGRPGRMAWIFFAYCIFSAPNSALGSNLTVLAPTLYALLMAGTWIASAIAPGFLLLFAILMPNDRPPPGWRRAASTAAWAITAVVGILALAGYGQGNWTFANRIFDLAVTGLTAATMLVVLARLIAMEREERARFGWAAFAIMWVSVIDLVRSSSMIPLSISGLVAVLTIVTPIALMYAILKRHVMDVRFVISRTVVYAAITTLVVGIIGLVDWATSAYLHEVRIAMALDALVTIGIAFALNRIHRWLEYAVDFVLFRKKYEAETYLKRLARTLHNANAEDTVDRCLVDEPYKRFELSTAALFRDSGAGFTACANASANGPPRGAFKDDHDLVRFLRTERARVHLRDLDGEAEAAVAIPIFQGNALTGFALYGTHRDGTSLDPDEVETLEHLCDAGAQAYTLIENSRYRSRLAPTPA